VQGDAAEWEAAVTEQQQTQTKGTKMAKFEVLTGEDAMAPWDADEKLQWWDGDAWVDRDFKAIPPSHKDIYRIKPQPKTIRKPLPDLRVLAGAMVVTPHGTHYGVLEISAAGGVVKLFQEGYKSAEDLMDLGWSYVNGGVVKPCWTEEEVEG
jgi:hypothetical protein